MARILGFSWSEKILFRAFLFFADLYRQPDMIQHAIRLVSSLISPFLTAHDVGRILLLTGLSFTL